MNLKINELRPHLTMWFSWWLGGWKDAWTRFPKPAALQTRAPIFQTLDGARLTFHIAEDTTAAWHHAVHTDAPQGLLIDDDDILLRALNLPPLGERDIAAAVAMDAQFASPFPPNDTHYGYNIQRLANGSLRIEIAIMRQSRVKDIQSHAPFSALFARGLYGAIPLQGNAHAKIGVWYRSPLTLSLSALLSLVLIAWIISPTLLLRAKAQVHEATLAKLNAQASPSLQKREELNTLQQQLENAHAFDNEHPDPLHLLELLSSQLPDSTWISSLIIRKDQLTLDGSSDNALAIVGLLEKLPDLKEVRLGASVNRDPRNGRETFQILARIQISTATPTSGATP